VHEAEEQHEQPASARRLAATPEILRADVENRQRDQRLGQPGREIDQAERRERERHRMSEGEAADDGDEGRPAGADQQQAEEKKQMIVTGKDVPDAEQQKIAKGRAGHAAAWFRAAAGGQCNSAGKR